MPTFAIPDSFKPALERIAEMQDNEVEEIRQSLESAAPSLKVESIIGHVRNSLKKDFPGIDGVVRTLISLNNARVSTDVSIPEFIRDISAPLAQRNKHFDTAVFERKLAPLLGVQSMALSARAFDVQHEYERLFIGARIMTDVRPVFDQTGTQIAGTMIVHNLNIKFSQAGDFKEIYVALDNVDIAKLRKVLDRADAKTAALEKLIDNTGAAYFESK